MKDYAKQSYLCNGSSCQRPRSSGTYSLGKMSTIFFIVTAIFLIVGVVLHKQHNANQEMPKTQLVLKEKGMAVQDNANESEYQAQEPVKKKHTSKRSVKKNKVAHNTNFSAGAKTETEAEPKYDFYTLLPQQKVEKTITN